MLLLEFAVQSHLQSSNPGVGQSAWESSLPGQCASMLCHAPTVLIRSAKLYPLSEEQQLFLFLSSVASSTMLRIELALTSV